MVDEAEAEAAELLLQTIYSASDPARPLRGADAAALAQVLKLAARLEVPCAVRAVERALLGSPGTNAPSSSSTGGRGLPWEVALAVFGLPTDSPAIAAASRGLWGAACEALRAELGDLDLAWLDGKRRRRLLLLPYEAIR